MFYKRITISIIFLLFLSLTSFIHAQSWSELFPIGSITTTRIAYTAVYDNTNNRMMVFGGTIDGGDIQLNDVWILSNANGLDSTTSTWTQLFPLPDPTQTTNGYGGLAIPRSNHTAVYDNTHNRMIIFGGFHESYGISELNDVWVLSNANGLDSTTPAWRELSPLPDPTQTTNFYGGLPKPRTDPSAVYDIVNSRMTIFGGYNASGEL
jgi:hypothetical protein